MFLVIHPIDSSEDLYLFFHADPRPQGCTLAVEEGVELKGVPESNDEPWILHDAEPGERGPQVVAQSRRAPKKFGVFRSELDVPMDFEILTNPAEVWAT